MTTKGQEGQDAKTHESPAGEGTGVAPPAFPDIGEPEASQETYLGDLKTREEAESWYREATAKLSDLDKWREESAQREQRLQDTINRLISSTPQQAGPQLTQTDDLSQVLDKLPDPVDKPEDFRRSLREAVTMAAKQEVSQLAAAQNQQGSEDRFYADFKARNQDLAKYDPIMRQATVAEANDIRARGGDPFQAWRTDPDGVLDRVARRTRTMLKDMGIDPASNDGERPDPRNQPPNRTGGIPGGTPAVNGTGGGKQAPASFIQDLKDLQSKSGFY